MTISTGWNSISDNDDSPTVACHWATPAPKTHALEADVYDRQALTPGHSQAALSKRLLMIGAGGLNSWIAVGLARMGASRITLVDPDVVERSNLNRQLYDYSDIGRYKGSAIARHIAGQATASATITGLAMSFQDAVSPGMPSRVIY